eukprot:11099805-Karenia_brevis.AAC.1
MDMIGKFEETAKSLEQASAENVFLQQKLNDKVNNTMMRITAERDQLQQMLQGTDQQEMETM